MLASTISGSTRGGEVYVSRPLPLRGVRNVRDLGGYPFTREDGSKGVTARGRFLRAGTLGGIRAEDIRALRQYGLRRVIDVRSNFELRLWPDPFARRRRTGIDYIHIPMLDQLNSSGFGGTLPERMSNVYRELLDDDGTSLRRVMEALDGPGCSLFHCRAGKDRTGVIAMLLLGLAGVDDAHIVADYAVTQRYMGRGLEAQRLGVSLLLRKPVPRCLFESDPAEMERTLSYLRERYGSARGYLIGHAGCAPELVDRLTARLRGDASPSQGKRASGSR